MAYFSLIVIHTERERGREREERERVNLFSLFGVTYMYMDSGLTI